MLKLANEHCTKRQFGVVSKYLKDLKQKHAEDIDAVNQQPLQRLTFQKNTTILTCNCIGEIQLLSTTLDNFESGSDAFSPKNDSATQTVRKEVQLVLPAKGSSDSDVISDTMKIKIQNKPDSRKENHNEHCANGSAKEHKPAGRLPVPVPKQNATFKRREFGQRTTAHCVKTKSDKKTCSVDALVALANGNIVLADSGNAKIKLFSRSFDLLDEVSVPGNPIDMCVIENSIYFCCSDSRKIFCLTTFGDGISSHVKSYETNGQPIGISKIDNELVVLFSSAVYDSNDCGKVDIEIRSGGELCETIPCCPYSSHFTNYVGRAKKIYSRPKFARSLDVILSEYNRISLYIVSRNTKELYGREWFYTPKNLQKARGLAIDSDNNVYVCGEDSNNVHLVSSLHPSFNRVVVPQIMNPISVCVDEQNQRLLVGCKTEDYVHSFSMTSGGQFKYM